MKRGCSLLLIAAGLVSVFGPLDVWLHCGWQLSDVYSHWWRNLAGGLLLIGTALWLRRRI